MQESEGAVMPRARETIREKPDARRTPGVRLERDAFLQALEAIADHGSPWSMGLARRVLTEWGRGRDAWRFSRKV